MPNDPRRVGPGNIDQIAEHGLNSRICERSCNSCQHLIMGEKVIAVEEADHIASGVPNTLVQSVVYSFVRLTDQAHAGVPDALDGTQRAIS